MGGWSTFGAGKFLQALLGNQATGVPATWYFQPMITAPTFAGGGSPSILVPRLGLLPNTSNFSAATGTGTVTGANAIPLTFLTASAGTQEIWTAIGLYDANAAGNFYAWWNIPAGQQPTVNQGTQYQVAIGNLKFALTSGAGGGVSDFAMKALINNFLQKAALGAPASWYLGGYTANPTSAGGGTESTRTGYARIAIGNDLTHFGAPGGTLNVSVTNLLASIFAALGGAGTETWTGYGLFDAPSAGNMWLWSPVTNIVAGNASVITFPAASIGSILTSS